MKEDDSLFGLVSTLDKNWPKIDRNWAVQRDYPIPSSLMEMAVQISSI